MFARSINDNLILFDSISYSDNAKVLSDYILENTKYKVVWLVDNKAKIEKLNNLKTVNRVYFTDSTHKHIYSVAAYYYALKARCVFYTHNFHWVGRKNKGQLFVNIWHGSGYKASSGIRPANAFDYMVVPGKLFVRSKAEFFECTEDEILPLGYPRYDLFKKDGKNKVEDFYTQLGLSNATKIIIWLPTFIFDEHLLSYSNPLPYIFSGMPLLETRKQLHELDDLCAKSNIKIIIKKHHYKYSPTPFERYREDLKNILVLRDDEFKESAIDLYELLPHTDALISDFSSVSVDYLLLDKPIGYVVADIEDYRNTRGFVFDEPRDYMPGEHIYDFEDLKEFVSTVASGIDKKAEERKNALAVMHSQTENYCERIVNYFQL